MNFPLLRHLVLKDVRHVRTRLALIWFMAYLLPATALLQDDNLFRDPNVANLVATSKALMFLLFCLIIVLTSVSVLLLDPTCGSNRFLKTRPVQWTTLLLSKFLFVLLFLWLPLVILRLGSAWTAGVHLSFSDQVFYLFETTLFFSAAASLFVLPALFFERITTVILFVVGFLVSCYVLALFGAAILDALGLNSIIPSPSPIMDSASDWQDEVSRRISTLLAICAVFALTIVPVAILRYWKPAFPIPLTLIFAALILALTFGSYWPYQIDQFFSDAPPAAQELPPALREQIYFTLQNPSWDLSRSWNGDSERANKYREFHLTQTLHFEGTALPLVIWRIKSNLEVTLPSGRRFSCQGAESAKTNFSKKLVDDYFRQECSGIRSLALSHENLDMTEFFTFLGHDYSTQRPDIEDSELPGASFRGANDFGVGRFTILKIVPFRPEARLDGLRQVCEVRRIVPVGSRIDYLLNRSSVPLLLRGDAERSTRNGMNSDGNIPFFIINRRTGEILDDSSESEYFNPFDGLHLQWLTLTKERPPGTPRDQAPPPIPAGWLDDAVICFYRFEFVGTITFPFSATVTNVIH